MVHYESICIIIPEREYDFFSHRTSLQPRKDTASVGSSPGDTGEFAVPECDRVSDWPLQTCNIILHVSAAAIGYTGPALHQAVALEGNITYINTGNLEPTYAPAPYLLCFTPVCD